MIIIKKLHLLTFYEQMCSLIWIICLKLTQIWLFAFYCKIISQNLVQIICCFWYVEFSHDNPKITTHFLFWSSSLSTVIRSITHRRMLCRLPFEITFCSFKNLGMDVTSWFGFVFNYLGIRWCSDFIFMNIMNYLVYKYVIRIIHRWDNGAIKRNFDFLSYIC